MRRFNALDWFRTGGCLLVLACAVLGLLSLDSTLREKWRSEAALQRLEAFEFAFSASTAINDERRPLERLMGVEPSAGLAQRAELQGARLRTDVAIRRFRLAVERFGGDDELNFDFLVAKLHSERARADRLLALPRQDRRVGEQTSVLRGLIAAGEAIDPMVATASRRVMAVDADLAGPVNIARVLGALHEAAMRLPSEIMPSLQSGDRIPPEARMAALRTQQRILALWDVGASQVAFSEDAPLLAAALADIRGVYFGKGFPFLTNNIERFSNRRPGPGHNASDIAQIYSGTLQPIARLRDLFVSNMIADARARQANAIEQAMITAGLTAFILFLLPILGWAAYRQVLRPLLVFRDQIVAISERRETIVQPYRGSVPQVHGLYRALQTLRDRERERIVLDNEKTALAERLRLMSVTDELTGILNRRGFDAARRSGPPPSFGRSAGIALLTMDIDHFKAVNDTYGHKAGDLVLQAVSRILDVEVGLSGVVARYGGEEFVVLLWDGDLVDTQMLAERLRARIEANEVPIGPNGASIRVTASFGIAFADGEAVEWAKLHEHADEALYAAKLAGRNRVRVTNRILSRLAEKAPTASGDRIVNRSAP